MNPMMFEELAAPFPVDAISWRVGSTTQDKSKGMALAFIDARDVMDRLDDVCTPGGWQCRYPHANGKTVCEIGIFMSQTAPGWDGWVWKSDGAGDTDYEADKGALSDAFKRAAVRWGVGRYLYHLPSPWVEVEQRGKTYVIKQDQYRKLEELLAKHTSDIEWGSSGEKAMARALYQSIKTTVQTEDAVRLYREQNAGVLANLRKAPREQIHALLDRITETSRAVAA